MGCIGMLLPSSGIPKSKSISEEKMKRLVLVLIVVVATVPAFAQESAVTASGAVNVEGSTREKKGSEKKKPTVKQTIVVTATRSARELSTVPVSMSVVTEKQIESTPAQTVDDMLRTIPGITLPFSSSLATTLVGARFSMHGLGGNKALVLLDGIPMHDPYYGTVEWQKVPLDSLERVEVVRGGTASLFGNYALGGTVNLITKPVDSSEVRIDLSSGSFATRRGMVTVDQKIGSSLGLRLSRNQLASDGYYIASNPGPVDVPVSNDSAITRFRADYDASGRVSGFFKADWLNADLNLGTLLSRSTRKIFDLAAKVHRAVGTSGLVSAALFREHEDLHLVNSSTAGGTNHISTDSVVPTTDVGGSLEWSFQHQGAIAFVSMGVDLQRIVANETTQSFQASGALRQVDLIQGEQQFGGIYGEASWRPSEAIEVLASARFDYFENSNGSDNVVDGPASIYPATSTTQFDPRVSVRYAIGSHSALRAAAYRAFRAPTLRELYRNTQVGVTLILGNPYLTPETLVGGELGWEWATPRAHVDINLFRGDVDGLQVRGPVPGQPANVTQNSNIGKSRSQGIEAMADFQLSRRWKAAMGYTYTDATIVSNAVDPTLVGKDLPEVVPHVGTLGVGYHGSDGLTIYVQGRFLSQSYGEPANVRPQPAHNVVDMSVSRPVTSWLDLYARGANIFDEQYYYVLNPVTTKACEPRNISVGARIHLPTGTFWGRD